MAEKCRAIGDVPVAGEVPWIELGGVRLHAVTEAQTVRHVLDELDARRGGWVITPNLDHMRRLRSDAKLRELYASASLVVADGMPLIWASRLQGTPLPERVAGSSVITALSARAAERGRSVYLLGGSAGTAQEAAEALRRRFPGIRVAGTYYPEMGFENDEMQIQQLIEHLNKADADIVYVGLGSPKQEWLIGRIRGRLPRAWWMGVGISFSFLSGHVLRAPPWMQKWGLEWLWRLVQEPRRLAKRYLLQGLPFAAWLLAGAVVHRVVGCDRGQV
jgi:N-acetylglucosaminyldiphosphoundecaprenol N-acetyl-beta-D-mannosaminyltransferase